MYPWIPSYFCRLVLDASELEVSKATEALAELPVVEASMDMVTFEISFMRLDANPLAQTSLH